MVTRDEELKWAYLLDPCFELTNSAGKPLTDGYIEVYIAGTRNKYYCASDFAGTLHPFQIPLDSLGSNIVLANPDNAYDVYVYNRFGNLIMSRYNVTPADGGAVISNTERINDLEELVVSAVTGLQGQIDDINEALDGKKDKQEEYSVTLTPTQTVSAIIQNENGEIEVIYQEIDLPEEVPNVDIVSPASTINITTHIDEETNTKTFSIDLSDLGHLEYGQYMATQDVFTGANMYRIKGNLGTTLDGKIQLHKGNSYHITVRGYYTCLDLSNTVDTLNYIEYSSYTTMPVNVDNTVAGPQYFEISYDIFKLSADTDYYIAFASSAGKVSDLTVEIHSLSNISILDPSYTFEEGWGIDITNNVISVDPSIIPESQVQSDWTEDDTDDPAYIKHKPEEYDLVAGNNISIDVQGSAVVISSTLSSEFATEAEVYDATVTAIEAVSAMIPDAQVQSDWTEYDPDNPAYIKNKPNIPEDKVYIFWDFEFNRTAIRAAIDAHKVIMDWDRTSNEHRFFTKYEEVTIDGNLCEIYHFAHVETDYTTPYATTWRLGDMAYIYDTVRQVQWAEHDVKMFDHEVPSPTSSDAGKVLTASWNSDQASGSWSWQPVSGGGSFSQIQSNWNEADNTSPAYIQNKPTIPTVQLNSDDQVTAINNYPIAGEGGGGTTYTAGDYISIDNNIISVTGLQVAGSYATISDISDMATQTWVGNQEYVTEPQVTALIPESEEVEFEEIDITQFAQASAIPVVTGFATKEELQDGLELVTGLIPEAQVQSNWTEDDSSEPSYIQNKPNELNLVAGQGINIGLSDNDIIISAVASGYVTDAEVYDATVTAIETVSAMIPDSEDVQFEEIDLSNYALVSAIPTVELNGNDQVTAINNHEIAGTGGGGTTYTAGEYISIENDEISVTGLAPISAIPTFAEGNCIDITSDIISWETTAGITDIVSVSALPVNPVATVLYLIPET